MPAQTRATRRTTRGPSAAPCPGNDRARPWLTDRHAGAARPPRSPASPAISYRLAPATTARCSNAERRWLTKHPIDRIQPGLKACTWAIKSTPAPSTPQPISPKSPTAPSTAAARGPGAFARLNRRLCGGLLRLFKIRCALVPLIPRRSSPPGADARQPTTPWPRSTPTPRPSVQSTREGSSTCNVGITHDASPAPS